MRPDTNPIVLDDIDPTLEWVEESDPIGFDLDRDFDAEDLGWVNLDVDLVVPVVGDATIDPGMPGTSRRSRSSTTNASLVNVPK